MRPPCLRRQCLWCVCPLVSPFFCGVPVVHSGPLLANASSSRSQQQPVQHGRRKMQSFLLRPIRSLVNVSARD